MDKNKFRGQFRLPFHRKNGHPDPEYCLSAYVSDIPVFSSARQIWTIGTQGEYRLKTAAFDVTPHIGVRWLRPKTGAFSTYNSQGTVFQTGSDTQNIWQIPVGVTLSRDYVARNGWTIKPELDIAFIAATGDRNVSTRIHVPGITASDVTRTEMMDSTSWNGSLGVIIQKDRLGIGFDAACQKSGNEKSRGFMLKINRQFD